MRIDPHVHCRDGIQAYKETIAHVLELAEAQGIGRVFDMPNTNPPILSRQDVKRRLLLVPRGKEKMYCLYVGLTADPEQIEEAVRCWIEFPEVVGLKMFAGTSVGPLAVIEDEEQLIVYQTLARLGYTGVLAVHCEREKDLIPDLWNSESPITHTLARPKIAEINSVANQIKFAIEAGFKGVLHICHISCSEAVELVVAARAQGEIRITCAVTPHHIMWAEDMLKRLDGWLYRVNPPLRSIQDVLRLRQQLKDGKIDYVESDHAPHSTGEKLFPPHLSGFPSLYLYKDFVENFLPSIGLSKTQIEALTFGNIVKAFSAKLDL